MDGIVHRTKKPNAKRPFPWGDVIIWVAGILALLVLFRVVAPVSDFLYGIMGVYVFTVFILIAVFGFAVKTGKRVRVSRQYLIGSILMVLSFFIALHIGFTQSVIQGGKSAYFGEYLAYCFDAHPITPGGVLFALPSYLLMVIAGALGSYLLLAVFFMVGMILVINCAISRRNEKRILTMTDKPEKEVKTAVDFDTQAAELYEKLQTTNKELLRENRRRFDNSKSLLGLGAVKNNTTSKTTAASPVSLSQLTTPEDINQASVAEAEALMNGLKMYNDGKVIPWQGVDSNAWSAVNPMPTPMPTPTMPTFGGTPIVSMPSLNNNLTNPYGAPSQPTVTPTPQGGSRWDQPNGMQWQGANTNWTPPAAPTNNPSAGGDFGATVNPVTNRRKNSAVLQNISKQTTLPIDTPPATPAGGTFKNKRYIKPSLDLIHTQSMDLSQFNAEASEKEAKLNELFQQYNVRAKVHSFNVAPAVTRFEIVPEMGTRVAQIENLRDDMNFVLKTNNTRMESPIEGKNAIGIEVPNRTIGTVSIKDLLASREFINHPSPLAICVGKNINDEPVIADLAEMPHLLVAGTTGSGKSVCINTILTSLIYKTSPEELKLLLIDMKGGVELGMYNGLPHMLVERCISNATHAVNAFKWLIKEMDHRYDLLQGQHVNNIALYQALPAYKEGQIPAMPYIVMVVDETADLMSRNKKEVEDCIQNLAQKSRAAGIHIVLATQRPSVDVISGVIKANIGTRIAFRVLSGVDSRTILDSVGAETLMGRGDMLFMTAKGVERVQGCYLANDELHRVVGMVREKNEADFNLELEDIILNGIPEGSATSFDDDGGGVSEQDPKLVAVLRYAVRENNVRQTLSISEIQRKFSVGFGRAGRIMDQLEQKGFVGADFGNGKPREVLVSRDQVAELYGL